MSRARVVFFSGGVGSWAAAKRVAEQHGTDGLTLLFTDTKTEHPDTYRFLREAAANVGGHLVEIADGRNIWQVFRDVRMLGNARVDPCSRILKRDLSRTWLEANRSPEDTTLYVGVDWTEQHRWERMRERWLPWRVEAPMCDRPLMSRDEMHEWAEREGLSKQALYRDGAPHANCGGGCVKMGQGGFARLLATAPDTFAEWEREEAGLRDLLGDIAILRDRTGGRTRPLPLSELRQRIERSEPCDLFDIGGCGCFMDAAGERANEGGGGNVMGTRADFYVGRGKQAEWLGSIAWDGYPSGVDGAVLNADSEHSYRAEVEKYVGGREDGTKPADGWPWPWDDSGTTEYAYAFDGGRVWASPFGRFWYPALEAEPDEESWPEGKVEFPDMSTRKAVTFGKRSGLIVFGQP